MELSRQQSGSQRPQLICPGSSLDQAGTAGVLLFRLEPGLQVHTIDEQLIGHLGQLTAGPAAFIISDAGTALEFSRSRPDFAFVVSPDPKILQTARAGAPGVHGVLDLRGIADPDPLQVRADCNRSSSRIMLLGWRHAGLVRHLQQRAMTVWLEVPTGGLPAQVAAFEQLRSGAAGLLAADADSLTQLLSGMEATGRLNLWRRPFVIGHRGLPSRAPENTIEGARLALGYGAEILECDVQLSRDGQVVVHHDDTLERTTSGSGRVDAHSLAELEQLTVNRQFPGFMPPPRLPSLQRYLQAFSADQAVHFLELKSADPALIAPTVSLVEQLGMEDRVVFISFHPGQLRLLQELLPGASVGFLTDGLHDGEPQAAATRVLDALAPFAATYNPGRRGLTAGFMDEAARHGVTVWPWTYRDLNEFSSAFLLGLGGLTTDNADWAEDWLDEVLAGNDTIRLRSGESQALTASSRSIGGSVKPVTPECHILSGSDCVSQNGATLTGLSRGTAWLTLGSSQQLPGGSTYWRWSRAVRVLVE